MICSSQCMSWTTFLTRDESYRVAHNFTIFADWVLLSFTCKWLRNHSKWLPLITESMKVFLIILSDNQYDLYSGSFLIPIRILITINCFIPFLTAGSNCMPPSCFCVALWFIWNTRWFMSLVKLIFTTPSCRLQLSCHRIYLRLRNTLVLSTVLCSTVLTVTMMTCDWWTAIDPITSSGKDMLHHCK